MARSHARITLGIWADRDWLALPMHAQWLYFAVVSQGDINHAGVIALTPRRWAKLCANHDMDMVVDALGVLTKTRFFVVDDDDEQLLVRSFVRNDGVSGQPNTLKSACASVLLVTSRVIRAALLGELRRLDQGRIGAMRTAPGHTPAVEVLRSTIATLSAEDTPPGGFPVTPTDGYADTNRDTNGVPLPCARAGAGEGEGEGVSSSPADGHFGGGHAREARPTPRRSRNREPGPGQRPLAAPVGPPPQRCPRCTRLGLAADDPGPACRACQRLRLDREQHDAADAERIQRAAGDDRAATAAARRSCERCDSEGWRVEYPGGPPVEPAIRCDHRPVQAVPARRQERLA